MSKLSAMMTAVAIALILAALLFGVPYWFPAITARFSPFSYQLMRVATNLEPGGEISDSADLALRRLASFRDGNIVARLRAGSEAFPLDTQLAMANLYASGAKGRSEVCEWIMDIVIAAEAQGMESGNAPATLAEAACVDYLKKALRDKREVVARTALRALAKLGGPEIFLAVIQTLSDQDNGARKSSMEYVEETITPDLIAYIKAKDAGAINRGKNVSDLDTAAFFARLFPDND